MTNLHDAVKAFHMKFGFPAPECPMVPFDKTMRWHLASITEQYLDVLRAAGVQVPGHVRRSLEEILEEPYLVDLPALCTSMAKLDYAVEGTRVTCGVKGRPIAEYVHGSNMKTYENRLVTAKGEERGEEAGAEDVEEILVLQGWTDSVPDGEVEVRGVEGGVAPSERFPGKDGAEEPEGMCSGSVRLNTLGVEQQASSLTVAGSTPATTFDAASQNASLRVKKNP